MVDVIGLTVPVPPDQLEDDDVYVAAPDGPAMTMVVVEPNGCDDVACFPR